MTPPSYQDVCEKIVSWLRSLGFKIENDEDYTNVMKALNKCNLIKDANQEDQSIILIDVEQFMRDNFAEELPSAVRTTQEMAKEFQEHLEEQLSAWITDEWEAFKKNRSE